MRLAVSGLAATAMSVALTATAFAQSAQTYYNQIQGGYQAGTIQPAATATYQGPTTAQQITTQPSLGSALYQSGTAYAPQPTTAYTPSVSAPAPVGNFEANPFGTGLQTSASPAAPLTQTLPSISTTTGIQQQTGGFATTTPSYASPYTPTTTATAPAQTYVAPAYGTATGSYQFPQTATLPTTGYGAPITSQPLSPPVPATAYTPSVPTSTAPTNTATEVQDTDTWSYNFARFYPAVQACLRRSTAKNPVVANIQERDNKTFMLIGEGGTSSFSTCSTGLTGTQVKANSDIRNIPPAFFAPLGSTFTVAPDRPFQPIVDTDQKVIGWLVRTQPTQGVNQFGQSVGFDGQFIPPMMVNTSVGKS